MLSLTQKMVANQGGQQSSQGFKTEATVPVPLSQNIPIRAAPINNITPQQGGNSSEPIPFKGHLSHSVAQNAQERSDSMVQIQPAKVFGMSASQNTCVEVTPGIAGFAGTNQYQGGASGQVTNPGQAAPAKNAELPTQSKPEEPRPDGMIPFQPKLHFSVAQEVTAVDFLAQPPQKSGAMEEIKPKVFGMSVSKEVCAEVTKPNFSDPSNKPFEFATQARPLNNIGFNSTDSKNEQPVPFQGKVYGMSTQGVCTEVPLITPSSQPYQPTQLGPSTAAFGTPFTGPTNVVPGPGGQNQASSLTTPLNSANVGTFTSMAPTSTIPVRAPPSNEYPITQTQSWLPSTNTQTQNAIVTRTDYATPYKPAPTSN